MKRLTSLVLLAVLLIPAGCGSLIVTPKRSETLQTRAGSAVLHSSITCNVPRLTYLKYYSTSEERIPLYP